MALSHTIRGLETKANTNVTVCLAPCPGSLHLRARAPWKRIARLNARRTRDCITVLINGQILSQGRRVAFVEAKDENGRLVRLEGAPYEPAQVPGQNPDLLPYSFNFKPPLAARELTLTLAVSRSHFIEFLAKPEQVREDSTAPRN